jgi:hypothetical protein
VILAVTAGCGGGESVFLNEVDLLPTKEALVELSLGHFGMPVPVEMPLEETEWSHGNALQLSFDLYAVVAPNDEEAVANVWSEQEGSLRDAILRLCRHATLDELTEPGLLSVKGRLTEVVSQNLGPRLVRRLVLTEVMVIPR